MTKIWSLRHVPRIQLVSILGTSPCDLFLKMLRVSCSWHKFLRPAVPSCKLFRVLEPSFGPTLNVQLVLFSRATGSVSNDSLSTFDVLVSKTCEITGDDIVTIKKEETCPWQHHNFNGPIGRQQSSIANYSTDNSRK